MRKHPRLVLLFIILLTLISAYIDLPNASLSGFSFSHPQFLTKTIKRDLQPKLGLDLSGGVRLVLTQDSQNLKEEDRDDALESARNIIESRVNALGVAEPVIQTSKSQDQRRIIVELAGVTDIDQAVATVKKVAHLQFKTVKQSETALATDAAAAIEFVDTNLTGGDLKKAAAEPSQDPQNPGYSVALNFNEEGAKKFEQITKENVGQPLAIFLDDELITNPPPIVQTVISDGNAAITGNFTAKEAKELSVALNAGALPAPLIIESQTRIGPTLGQDSIQKSLIAAAVGIVSITFFMIAYYRILGVFAAFALIIYSLLVFAIFKLVPVTLTLAGIAGFILSIGMAVDANILIFERIKEERRWGKNKSEALYSGFSRAWSSIRDSNVSSLITTAILFYFGTGPIRGFALTLAIGITVSMFTAITVSRTFLRLFWVRSGPSSPMN